MFAGNNKRGMAGRHAFSLVEVVLAIGIMAFGLIVIVGLLPVGLKSNRDSAEESQAVNIMQAVIADRQSTDYSINSSLYGIQALNGSNAQWLATGTYSGSFALTDGGSVTSLQASGTAVPRYKVVYTLYYGSLSMSNTTGDISPIDAVMNIRVSWPAQQSSGQASSVETSAVFMQQ